MLNKLKSWWKQRNQTKEQRLYVERAKRHGRGPSFAVDEQNRLCAAKKCQHEPIYCYNTANDGVTVWLEERTVIHACADSSQFAYKARMGIAGVYCAFLQRHVEMRVFEASVVADVLVMDGHTFDFCQRSLASIVYRDEEYGGTWITTYRRPMFGVTGVYQGWEEFTAVLEAEMDQREPLRDFHVETAPYDEESRYQWRIEKDAD